MTFRAVKNTQTGSKSLKTSILKIIDIKIFLTKKSIKVPLHFFKIHILVHISRIVSPIIKILKDLNSAHQITLNRYLTQHITLIHHLKLNTCKRITKTSISGLYDESYNLIQPYLKEEEDLGSYHSPKTKRNSCVAWLNLLILNFLSLTI